MSVDTIGFAAEAAVRLAQSGALGETQVVAVTAAGDPARLTGDLRGLAALCGETADVKFVSEPKPYPHAVLSAYFPNGVLARYVFTASDSERCEWRVYGSDAALTADDRSIYVTRAELNAEPQAVRPDELPARKTTLPPLPAPFRALIDSLSAK